MTRGAQARRDLEDVLRRTLHAAVDAIEPADDGLIRIMHRLTTPSVVRRAALLVTDCVDLARLIAMRFEPAFTVAMRLRWRLHAGYWRRKPRPATWVRPRPGVPWLGPAVAVASAVMIVVLGTVVLSHVRQIATWISLNTGPGAGAPAHPGTQSAGGGRGLSPTANGTQTGPGGSGTTPGQVGPSAHHSCAPASCRPGTGTPVPSPATTPSPSPTADPGQSSTPTPSKTKHSPKPHPTHSPHGPKG